MAKTLKERHEEKQAPCETETELRKAAETGQAESMLALATALINKTIEHQDPDEALCWLEKTRVAIGSGSEAMLEQISAVEQQAKQRQREFQRAFEVEMLRQQDA